MFFFVIKKIILDKGKVCDFFPFDHKNDCRLRSFTLKQNQHSLAQSNSRNSKSLRKKCKTFLKVANSFLTPLSLKVYTVYFVYSVCQLSVSIYPIYQSIDLHVISLSLYSFCHSTEPIILIVGQSTQSDSLLYSFQSFCQSTKSICHCTETTYQSTLHFRSANRSVYSDFQSTQSISVNSIFQSTQPISLRSLPSLSVYLVYSDYLQCSKQGICIIDNT